MSGTAEIEDQAGTRMRKTDMLLLQAHANEGIQKIGTNTTGTHASLSATTGIEEIVGEMMIVEGDVGMTTIMEHQEEVVMGETFVIAEMDTVIGGIVTEMTDTLVVEAGRGTMMMTATTTSEEVAVVAIGGVQRDETVAHLCDAAQHLKALSPSESDQGPTPSGTFLHLALKVQVLLLPKRLGCSVFQARQDW